jgi:hypothetical protein
MRKAARTQRRYQKAFRGQGKLTGFGFKAPHYDSHLQPLSGPGLSSLSKQRGADTVSLNPLDHVQPPPQESLQDSRKRSASILSDPSTDHDICSEGNVLDGQDLGVIDEGAKSGSENRSEISDSEPVIVDPADHDEEIEDWEAELEEVVEGPKSHIETGWTSAPISKNASKNTVKPCHFHNSTNS